MKKSDWPVLNDTNQSDFSSLSSNHLLRSFPLYFRGGRFPRWTCERQTHENRPCGLSGSKTRVKKLETATPSKPTTGNQTQPFTLDGSFFFQNMVEYYIFVSLNSVYQHQGLNCGAAKASKCSLFWFYDRTPGVLDELCLSRSIYWGHADIFSSVQFSPWISFGIQSSTVFERMFLQ